MHDTECERIERIAQRCMDLINFREDPVSGDPVRLGEFGSVFLSLIENTGNSFTALEIIIQYFEIEVECEVMAVLEHYNKSDKNRSAVLVHFLNELEALVLDEEKTPDEFVEFVKSIVDSEKVV